MTGIKQLRRKLIRRERAKKIVKAVIAIAVAAAVIVLTAWMIQEIVRIVTAMIVLTAWMAI